ncbi:phytoene desaturase family protein [Terriglobus saanensis]|uniref:Fumarate reductase/succinate dehydrogenase flavoprotein domain protein n=1 Tax=Terriglobus saanensis (strain ATCC BAA-1853 / DSM 23119 / SP1PR4) TaxID=401053 RepID=E8V3R6_TERSS|nr:NAD(P)/FAD-dependent oxidoreductase [Terriglobus saanensis]ADV84753.1 fumarate reductase/succinate dehydrogenase flavoprotein domain protein [Terriglobus saanensis SP1PR4]
MGDFDAVVVGAGPNGLAAAITMQRAGLRVLLLEAKSTVGGGMRSAELTLPGFVHDVCSAIHPLGAGSPFFRELPLKDFGLEWIEPPVLAAHPFDDGTAAALMSSLEETTAGLGEDREAYARLYRPLIAAWPKIEREVLGPVLAWPPHPLEMVKFGVKALLPASALAKRFRGRDARGLLAGMAAHGMQPLTSVATAATALVLMIAGHRSGWPMARGGSQKIADALAAYFVSLGGVVETGVAVERLEALPPARVTLLDVGPKQLLQIAAGKLSSRYRSQLEKFEYGPGAFKVDWALDGPVPFASETCRRAGTVHLGGTFEEIAQSEAEIAAGKHSENPFLLFAQQSLFDATRAPSGRHTAWGYCHVPNGSTVDRIEAIEAQVERFAPGFRDRILARHTMNTYAMQAYNANYVGGDINGGALTLRQIVARPVLLRSPYRTSMDGVYLCSASTPPGGGVHGMCGFHAARRAMADCFGISE